MIWYYLSSKEINLRIPKMLKCVNKLSLLILFELLGGAQRNKGTDRILDTEIGKLRIQNWGQAGTGTDLRSADIK